MPAVTVTRYVGVVGPGTGATATEVEQAIDLGRLLAQRGWVVVTGGLGGVMAGAARGCAEADGTSLGLLPGDSREEADPHLTLAVPTGLGEMRNALLVRTCDVVVGIGHSWGTLSEIALACRTGVPVVLVDAPSLFDHLPAGGEGRAPVHADTPEQAVRLVTEVLGDATPPGSVVPDGHVLGVDGTRGGWVGALLPASGEGTITFVSGPDLRTLIERACSQVPVHAVAVDTPIGLPDTGRRQADVLARRRLGRRASSVFSTPVRDALAAETYAQARQVSLERTGGTSLSAQSYALRTAILDVDGYVGGTPDMRVVEVHPELSFAVMSGAPLMTRKRDPEGVAERLGVLRTQGIELAPSALEDRKADDLLDAAAAAWTASRLVRGVSESLPDPPERFSDGLDAAIVV